MRIRRIHPETGELFTPYRYGDGLFRVADPTLGKTKHHAANQVAVDSETELIRYIARGFSCRMRGTESGKVNLIPADVIMIDGITPDGAPLPKMPVPPSDMASIEAPMIEQSASARNIGLLPRHGRITCSACFGTDACWGATRLERGGWRLENNPMSWGGRNPRILVLGFSKGGNQNSDILNRPHDEVAFRGGRKGVSQILATLSLMPEGRHIDEIIADEDGDLAFGSLVRCSVSKFDRRRGEWVMSGADIMASCLDDGTVGDVVSNCVGQFIALSPPRLRLVVMFGNQASYVDGCFKVIARHRQGLRRINPVAYGDDGVTFVHTVHFKAQGKLLPEWVAGKPGLSSRDETDQPLKRQMALQAVQPLLPLLRPNEHAD